ncbi:MAG: mono/diheme cytochrome c family protein [Kiritimatiellia bacterium]|jgi:mono/diheme cytochrome c family protein
MVEVPMRTLYRILPSLLVLGCGPKEAPAPAVSVAVLQAPAVAANATAQTTSVSHYTAMHALLGRVDKAREAVVAGRLDQTIVHLKALSVVPSPYGLPEGAEVWMDRIREAAHDGTQTDRSVEMGEAIANILTQCGGCHDAHDGGPRLTSLEPTPPDDMNRHAWADKRFFEGLVTPSSLRWEQGAAALIFAGEADPVFLAGLTAEESEAANILHERVHSIGNAAITTQNQGHRVAVYGAFLAACAECHTITGGGPEKAR